MMLHHALSRRGFLQSTGLALAAASMRQSVTAADSKTDPGRIARITHDVIFAGRTSGPSWFHPRPCVIPTGDGDRVLMTLQTISGSDVFGPVHWTITGGRGATWSDPQPIPGLERRALEPGWEAGVCDVVPEYHAKTGTVLAIGHDVFYKDRVLARPQRERRPVYVVRSADGSWSAPRHLEWDEPKASAIFTCGCSQRVTLPDGDVLIPISFGTAERTDRAYTTLRCSFDGESLAVREVGNELANSAGRGLLEPSLTMLDGRYFLTLRAEDGKGYVSDSKDGLHWEQARPWCWDDGEPLEMSTTQQHWLPHSDALFLVYNRKAAGNENVIRWRAPLFVAEVDRTTLRLKRDTEQVALPLVGDAAKAPRNVALMGNFHTLAVTSDESWVTVGENRPYDGYRGDTLLARIRWTRPNRLASEPG